ncbi:MAG: carboxymuconolactone decarboxylase family protein [Actinomycetota bacterium]|nr:carboxymuconolactone decarboxylase family protein [Actinomycetota bacterium]
MTQTPPPRILPLGEHERDAFANSLIAEAAGPDRVGITPNIWTTLVRHPGLFRRWIPFGGKLLAGKIPLRDREIMILRTAWRCRVAYEWSQHSKVARAAGLTDAELSRIAEGPNSPGWTPFEAALLRCVDELHDESSVTDETWATLADVYDEKQLIELPMLIGQYHLVAFTMNALRFELEPDAEHFPSVTDEQ